MAPTFKKPKGRRFKTVEKLNLSEHTLNVNIRKCSYEKFRFSDVEDYVRAISGGREYQFEAIKQTMIYLWGGGYKNVSELALENFERKSHIKQRFGTTELMLGSLPMPDRLSGVVHMATGTGKSWAIFAVAYLSLVMGLTKRVLVLGPPSTIIEQGLREKFREFLDNKEWNDMLPKQYQGKAITLASDNDAIEDDTIVIENINAVFTFGGIQDTFFKNVDDVLVLSDEVHHAYSHLKFNATGTKLELDTAIGKEGKGEDRNERLWMQFLLGVGRYGGPEYRRANGVHKITRHIGFTGTPYNSDDFFADVIFDYNVRTAIEQKYIKDINPIIRTETDEGAIQWTTFKKFEVVLKNHMDNAKEFAYLKNGVRQVKPITVFYCPTIANANARTEEFIRFLAKWEKENAGAQGSEVELEQQMRERVICVTGSNKEKETKAKLDAVEEIDENKVGGKVEFIFSVSKLLEGWDVDNVFQIVPMEEKVFNSKLLISQVIGRGLRIPRKITYAEVLLKYPMLTVTNHESFAEHVQELVYAVTHSDMFIVSEPLKATEESSSRDKYHFSIFNLTYLSGTKIEDAPEEQSSLPSRELILTKYPATENAIIEYGQGTKKYGLQKKKISVDFVVDSLYRRFKTREYENIQFDFGQGEQRRCPTEDEIRKTIMDAMGKADISTHELADDNRKQIELYFNQFLPRGKKKRVIINVTGDIDPIGTSTLPRETLRVGELERDASAFLSEDYANEVDEKTKAVLRYVTEGRGVKAQQQISFNDPQNLLGAHGEYVRTLIDNDPRPPYIVNPSVLKSPQNTVLVSYYPEKEFVFRLLENAEYVDGWIKSPDKGFYSIDYEYWKSGKDRVRRGFNPDFFVRIDLERYMTTLIKQGITDGIDELRALQERGIEELIRVVEIKSDGDDDEATPAKAEYATAHFKALNEKLRQVNPIDVSESHRSFLKQHYTFDLLKPDGYSHWFESLISGKFFV